MYDAPNRLLIVDPDMSSVQDIRAVGDDIGYAIATADELTRFLQLVDEFRPTVIVMDMDLPGADGVQALGALASRGCSAQIILAGGTDRRVLNATQILGSSRGLSMAGLLCKPLVLQDIQTALSQAFSAGRKLGVNDIEQALEDGNLIAFFQPTARLIPGRGWQIDAVEALVRWHHPELGLVMPDEFIPQAEQSGQIGRLTEQMLHQSLKQLKAWQGENHVLRCAVNLPPCLVTDPGLPDRIAEAMQAYSVAPDRLTLELTETATMQDPTTTTDIMTRLRAQGIGLSVDDFGTGYSSITRLHQMPFDEMKIDKTLVMNVPRSREANTLVGSLIELGHNLGLTTCAEGVECRAALDLLAALGSDRCQGYFISRALPAADIGPFIDSWNSKSPASAQNRSEPAGASPAASGSV